MRVMTRLDKHLLFVHNIQNTDDRDVQMRQAKRNSAVKELAQLRGSNPVPAMVSTLDLEEVGEVAEVLDSDSDPEPPMINIDLEDEDEGQAAQNTSSKLGVSGCSADAEAGSSIMSRGLPLSSVDSGGEHLGSSGGGGGPSPLHRGGGGPSPLHRGAGGPSPLHRGGGGPSPLHRGGGGPSPLHRGGGGPSPLHRGGGGPSPLHRGAGGPSPSNSQPLPCSSTPHSGVKVGRSPRSVGQSSGRRNLTRLLDRESEGQRAPSPLTTLVPSQVGCSSVSGCQKLVERKVGAMFARLERSLAAQVESAISTMKKEMKKDMSKMQRQLASISSASTNAVQQPLHTSTGGLPFSLLTSPQKGEHIRLSRMTGCYVGMVEDFRVFKLARRTGKKDTENARQRSSHALRFCHFMAAGLSAAQVSNLKFVMNVEKLRSFPQYLVEKGFAPTTIKNILLNCRGFLRHVQAKFQARSKLRPSDFENTYYELKSMLAEVQRGLTAYRQRVLAQKSSARLAAQDVLRFMETARTRIPELLDKLAQGGPDKQAHILVQGYLMGYLALLTGHRSVVLQNLCTQDVMKCQGWHRGQRYMLLIDDHKTAKKFGQATVNLNTSEYTWLVTTQQSR
ncbi:uncharacterized protein LOC144001582 [Festucalex cinctus]